MRRHRQSSGVLSSLEKLEPRQLFASVPPGPQQQPPPPHPPGPPPPPPINATPPVRSYDGSRNNAVNSSWGGTGQQLIRLAASAYGDSISTPAGANRPSARAISNAVSTHGAGDIPSSAKLSAYAYLWGQFVDHDLDLTSAGTAEELDVPVPTSDPYFDPASTGTQVIGFTRSVYVAGTGVTTPRQQANEITAFLDGSMVYGSDAARAMALRTLSGGMMKTSAGNMLPYNTMGLDNATLGGPAGTYFAAGDVRANENVELTSMQTLFVREHNRRASQIAAAHPGWTDEQLYQAARRLVIAEIEQITYNEFLPALLGRNAIQPYRGYMSNVNPGISTEFSTAAFRLGHSMLPDDVEFLDNNGNAVRDELPLADAFFNPALVSSTGVDPILKYLATSNSEEIDTKVVDGLRNFLFGPPGAGGFDLASLNIQRGRDHGLADYNSTRAALGLPKVTSFAQITSDTQLQATLQSLYGSVDNVDLWVGGLAEDHVPGSNVGPTFQRILVDQFTRTRDGDRFWYQNALSPDEMRAIHGVTLADIVKADTGVANLQADIFHYNPTITGAVFNDFNADGKLNGSETGLAGRKVKLIDGTGAVLQTTLTDRTGHFMLSGLDIGSYSVQIETPAGWKGTSKLPATITVTRGGVVATINAGQHKVGTPTQPPPKQPAPPPTAQGGISTPMMSAWGELAGAESKLPGL